MSSLYQRKMGNNAASKRNRGHDPSKYNNPNGSSSSDPAADAAARAERQRRLRAERVAALRKEDRALDAAFG